MSTAGVYEGIKWATIGGTVLGLSTSAYMALVGRVSGMSGSLRNTYLQLTQQKAVDPLHVVYVGGLLIGGAAVRILLPASFELGSYDAVMLVVGGLLTGVGTTIGHGCTSGHGLCGLARLSFRSLVAVGTFFTTGLATCTALHPMMKTLWTPSSVPNFGLPLPYADTLPLTVISGSFLSLWGFSQLDLYQALSASVCSIAFSFGLGISGMLMPSKIHGFLALTTGWDPSLMFVMMGGLVVNVALFPLIRRLSKPVTCPAFDLPTSTHFDPDLVIGGVLFGLGWAIGGLCPGPGIVGIAGPYGLSSLIWTTACIAGQQLTHSQWKDTKAMLKMGEDAAEG
eukprot:CAMPEP_0184482018 /NCGR_PEP_ID=MMETSP0113_2-20130426/3594_1 /TAXON_ID=91329 /ORGANISM="Norrisiella sphaerica, Strain BC52" /LENGTH=338 /DNA_ID=CAMNT_0026861521 /DNA_START=31 /DNA_END=1047 /DNA_ORIENTATION=+